MEGNLMLIVNFWGCLIVAHLHDLKGQPKFGWIMYGIGVANLVAWLFAEYA